MNNKSSLPSIRHVNLENHTQSHRKLKPRLSSYAFVVFAVELLMAVVEGLYSTARGENDRLAKGGSAENRAIGCKGLLSNIFGWYLVE